MDNLAQSLLGESSSDFLRKINIARYDYLKQREVEFRQLFGKDLSRYVDKYVGFNSVKFWDEFFPGLENVDGISYDDATKEQFGNRASALISELICSSTIGVG